MVDSTLHSSACLEVLVLMFQVMGVAGLFLSRLFGGTIWGHRGRISLIVALVGLGVTGALLGVHDSAFAQFAGGTMTLLLIGTTIGNGGGEVVTGSVAAEAA